MSDEGQEYAFEGGFPTVETIQRVYDDADLNRAIQTYRFLYPTVSSLAIFRGSEASGLRANAVFGMVDTERWLDRERWSEAPRGRRRVPLQRHRLRTA